MNNMNSPKVFLAICLSAIMLPVGALAMHVVAAEGEPTDTANMVRLTIDYGDGVEKHFTQLAHRTGMTVKDLLDGAAAHPRGIKYVAEPFGNVGSLIKSIDGAENEGSGRRNWLFSVNDKMASKAFDKLTLEKGDNVRWYYTSKPPKFPSK